MKKRRALAQLIGDLSARTGSASSRAGRLATPAATAPRSPARKPPARVEADTRVVPASPRRLKRSPILAALAKVGRADGRRHAAPSRRGARAS